MVEAMRSVLLVEDDPRVRTAVRELLDAEHTRYTLVGEAATVADAHAQLRVRTPDVLLLDLQLPDGSGLEVLGGAITSSCVAVILTVFDDDAHLFESLRAGAVGYLLKDDLFEHLLPSLDDVCAGGAPMSASIARRVLRSFRAPPEPPAAAEEPSLTPREVEVLALLARGCTYDEVARMLAISSNTVRTYIRSTYEKLHVSSKTEAALEAIRRGLIRRT
jgi:DNA-binding NarL/FixJ family response regulator